MTHGSVPPEVRATLGIGDTLVRLSVGIEDADDLIADLSAAWAEPPGWGMIRTTGTAIRTMRKVGHRIVASAQAR